ncbi:MAG: PAS domain-containing protein [Gammaproteobacteria bacterium]|jgi:PAS domain-containing protein
MHQKMHQAPGTLNTPADWLAVVHPDDVALYKESTAALLRGDVERLQIEYRYRAADGTTRWASQHGLVLRRKDGRAYRITGSTGDITERKQLETTLGELRTQLQEAVESISEGSVIFDADDHIVLCNSVYRNFFIGFEDLVVPGAHFETIIGHGARIGMFAEAEGRAEEWLLDALERRATTSRVREQHLAHDR